MKINKIRFKHLGLQIKHDKNKIKVKSIYDNNKILNKPYERN